MTSTAPALIVFYCPPFLPRLRALDIEAAHLGTFRDRLASGAFCPRTLHLARPDCFRDATPWEVRALRAAGCAPHYVHDWCTWDPSLATDVDPQTLLPFPSEVQA